jgi:hypothetical protein
MASPKGPIQVNKINHLHCIIYGSRERINSFLLDQQLIQESPVMAAFKHKMTMHTIEQSSSLGSNVIPPEITVLNFELHMRHWKVPRTTDGLTYRDMWLEFLNHALHFHLEWEIVWIGSKYPELEWIHTPAAKKILVIQQPRVTVAEDFGPNLPLNSLT